MKSNFDYIYNPPVRSYLDCAHCAHLNKYLDSGHISCGYHDSVNVIVLVWPSFYNKGFTNGEGIVYCPELRAKNTITNSYMQNEEK